MLTLKCLTLYQPWATLVMLGEKRFETRSWNTAYRGKIGIHAGTKSTPGLRRIAEEDGTYQNVLGGHGLTSWDMLPRGVLLGTVTLVDCLRVELLRLEELSRQEEYFGNYSPGRWAWRLAEPVLFPEPLPLRGQLGLFDATL